MSWQLTRSLWSRGALLPDGRLEYLQHFQVLLDKEVVAQPWLLWLSWLGVIP